MAHIGNLVAYLTANTSRFGPELQRGAGGPLKRLSAQVGAASRRISGTFGMGTALSAGGLIAGLGLTVKLANQQEQAEKKLAGVLAATGGAAELSLGKLKDFAAGLQRITNFGDEATISAMAVLATFKNIKGDNFKQATRAAQDMSAVLGQSLDAGMVQLGKALNDPIRGMTALSRVGVTFTEQQKQQIKVLQESGDLMGAQRVILGELKSEFGGAAAAMADPMVQLKNSLGDIGESIGMELLPFAKMLSTDLVASIDKSAASAERAGGGFSSFAAAVFGAADAMEWLNKKLLAGQIATTKAMKWDEETRQRWWGKWAKDDASIMYIEELTAKIKDLEKQQKAMENKESWSNNLKRRYRTIMDEIKNVDGALAKVAKPRTEDIGNAALKGAQRMTAEMEKQKKLKDDMRLGKSIFESMRTPLEGYEARLKDLRRLFEVGAIDPQTYARAKLGAAKSARGFDRPYAGTPAVEKGTQAAFTAEARFRHGATRQTELERIQKEALADGRELLRLAEERNRILEDREEPIEVEI